MTQVDVAAFQRFGVLPSAPWGIMCTDDIRELCLIVLAVTTILIANSVRTEISLEFPAVCSRVPLCGTLHPNAQAPYCATMALSGVLPAHGDKHGMGGYSCGCYAGPALSYWG